jgi:hypothetical protein
VGVLEDVAHPPPPHTQLSAALEADTSSGAGPSSSAGPFHDDAPDLGLDIMTNIIDELGLSQFDNDAPDLGLDIMTNIIAELELSQFDNDAPFTPTQPTPP